MLSMASSGDGAPDISYWQYDRTNGVAKHLGNDVKYNATYLVCWTEVQNWNRFFFCATVMKLMVLLSFSWECMNVFLRVSNIMCEIEVSIGQWVVYLFCCDSAAILRQDHAMVLKTHCSDVHLMMILIIMTNILWATPCHNIVLLPADVLQLKKTKNIQAYGKEL